LSFLALKKCGEEEEEEDEKEQKEMRSCAGLFAELFMEKFAGVLVKTLL
jgi:hypothetical protein